MGAWGAGPFENDTAADLLADLAEGVAWAPPAVRDDAPLPVADGERALAMAAVVAAGRQGRDLTGVDHDLDAVALAAGLDDTAVRRIHDLGRHAIAGPAESDLFAVWSESDDLDEWLAASRSAVDGLVDEVAAAPAAPVARTRTRPRRKRLPPPEPGDVLALPLGDGRVQLGQVVARVRTSPYVVLVDLVVPAAEAAMHAARVPAAAPVLAAEVTAIRVEDGDWPVVGRAMVDPDRFLPASKVSVPGPDGGRAWIVEDLAGERRRWATPDDVERLPLRTSYSPAALEHAARALAGLGEWLDGFERMRVERIPLARDAFPG
ncbi:DUF4259 domain-containing protein [Clavibacter capsici]|uniref:DUF4259 domain-containing protein n=1 Tax=Clavibacter capsici TaxID=1874630 RepID=UPI0014284ADD|nr:DUF4259 domain-containing protein [Clavibacter capsici]QIS38044.1 DUF4259 domain-containing protein [Clavibacter capsici]